MITKPEIDEGHAFDWGKTSPDYAVYRPGYPASFYTVLQALGIGTPGQDILDLGTGTGVLARGCMRIPPLGRLTPCRHQLASSTEARAITRAFGACASCALGTGP